MASENVSTRRPELAVTCKIFNMVSQMHLTCMHLWCSVASERAEQSCSPELRAEITDRNFEPPYRSA